MPFTLPSLSDNPDGWGPLSDDVPAALADIPYAPFNRSDRLGRISDWNSQRWYNNRWRGKQFGHGMTEVFAYNHKDDESSFSLVDNTPKYKPRDGRRRYKKFSVHNRRRRGRGFRAWGRRGWNSKDKKGGRGNFQRRRWGFNYTPEAKDPSTPIKEAWKEEGELAFDGLRKSWARVGEPQNLVSCGALMEYNTFFDRVTPRAWQPLKRFEKRQHFTATTSADPVLQRLMKQGKGNVFGTDTILAVLMACYRSVNAWDIVVRRVGDNLIFDKRAGSRIDFLSVNENWNEVQETDLESVNHPENLATEATFIGHNFSQQVLRPDKKRSHKFVEANPFLGSLSPGHVPASVGYRYRKWDLGDGINLVARCQLSAYTTVKGEKQFLMLKALNEFDSKMSGNIDWRQKLEQQTGAVLANEMKNNSNKLVRWTAEMVLSGCHEMRLGFVSRSNTKDNCRHVVLKSQRYKPGAFAASITVKLPNLWGVLKAIIMQCMELKEGTYLLMRDPNDPKLNIFNVGDDPLTEA